MGRTVITLALAVICNVAAILIGGIAYLLNGSLGGYGLMSGMLIVVGAFINPPRHEVEAVLEAIANTNAKGK